MKQLMLKILFILIFGNTLFATSFSECTHLLQKIGMGIDEFSLNRCTKAPNYTQSVKRLVTYSNRYKTASPFLQKYFNLGKSYRALSATDKIKLNKEKGKYRFRLKEWWIESMLKSKAPLKEAMVLFWSNHFTTKIGKIQQPYLLYRQNMLFREYALGNYREFLHKIIQDPAMLIFLDNRVNRKKHPNENFAREILELFTLGVGNYTQKDIVEFSRALSGYGLDRNMTKFKFYRKRHDNGIKNFLGYKGMLNAHQAIDIILQKKAVSVFVVKKLWRYFISDTPYMPEVNRLAKIFRDSNYNISSVVEAIFLSPYFKDKSNSATIVKSPIELIVGTLRTLKYRGYPLKKAVVFSSMMGQNPFNPPNVRGWVGGKEWLNSHTLMARRIFIDQLFLKNSINGIDNSLFLSKGGLNIDKAVKILSPIELKVVPFGNFNKSLKSVLMHPAYQLK